MEKGLKCSICEYCGHVRCNKCLLDRWQQLADGCCSCLARILKQARRRVD